MLPSVPKCEKLCLTEKIGVSGELPPGVSRSAGGREFNVNEPRIHTKSGAFKEKHTQNGLY